jgi:hypothetical protein
MMQIVKLCKFTHVETGVALWCMGGALDLIKYYFNNTLITSQLTLNIFFSINICLLTHMPRRLKQNSFSFIILPPSQSLRLCQSGLLHCCCDPLFTLPIRHLPYRCIVSAAAGAHSTTEKEIHTNARSASTHVKRYKGSQAKSSVVKQAGKK